MAYTGGVSSIHSDYEQGNEGHVELISSSLDELYTVFELVNLS